MKKRWFILILVLVVIAVVLAIVFVNLFREKNTSALADSVNSVTQSGYLSKENKSNQEIDEYLNSMLKLSENIPEDYLSTLLKTEDLQAEKNLIKNYANAYAAFEVVGEFFNREIVFTKYTNVYKSQKKKIQKNFSNAQSAVDALSKYFNEQNVKIGNADEWLARTWDDCKSNLVNLFNYTSEAFSGLTEVYKSCVNSVVLNNGLSDIILDEVGKMTVGVLEGKVDFGEKLLNFVNAYLTREGEKLILDYSYVAGIQLIVKDIKEKGEDSSYYANFVAGNLV